jgi:glycosyltransferase involved in cell wall biosynthesis
MKILVINWQDIKNPLGGGAEVHLHEIFKRIADKGHDVTVFSCEIEGLPNSETIDGIKIIRKGSRNLFNFYVPYMYFKFFRHQNYDIIIDDINKIPFYTPLYVKEPLMAISHHFFGKSIFHEANIISGMYVVISEYFVNHFYQSTPFAVVSESTLNEFIERGFDRNKFIIARNAYNKLNFPLTITDKNPLPTITYFGRLKKYKSVDHLFKAFALVCKTIPDVKLEIIGKGDYRHQLEKLAIKLGIESKVLFHGFVSDDEKIKLLSKSHIVVNTSMKEGWGITNIEANACGTPVVSANVPGLRDSVKEGQSGLLYEYGDIRELAECLIKILTENELQQHLSEGALEWANQFNWEDSVNIMIETCEKVIREFNRN